MLIVLLLLLLISVFVSLYNEFVYVLTTYTTVNHIATIDETRSKKFYRLPILVIVLLILYFILL